MKSKILIIAVLTTALLIFGIYHYAKTRGFSARVAPHPLEAYVAKTVRRFIVPSEIKMLKNPVKVTPLLIAEARDHFADHCAVCHANNGSGTTVVGSNMYPPAPDMRSGYTQSLSDGELFYIIKEGVRFSGMPGWGGEDNENWKLVHFIRHLPNLTQEEIEYMNEINNLETKGLRKE